MGRGREEAGETPLVHTAATVAGEGGRERLGGFFTGNGGRRSERPFEFGDGEKGRKRRKRGKEEEEEVP